MKVIKLNQEELQIAQSIVNQYRQAESEFNSIQKQLEALEEQKNQLVSKMTHTHNEELEFFKLLETSHGKGNLDLLTFEYITE